MESVGPSGQNEDWRDTSAQVALVHTSQYKVGKEEHALREYIGVFFSHLMCKCAPYVLLNVSTNLIRVASE